MILVAVPQSDEYRELLTAAAPGQEFVFKNPAEVVESDLEGAEILVGNLAPAMLKNAKNLKLIQLISAGYDRYTGKGQVPEGCAVCCSVGAYGLSVSEYAIAGLMALNRRFKRYIVNQEKSRWVKGVPVKSIFGSTILILGAGSIGGDAAKAFKAMGAYIIGTKRSMENKPEWLDELHLLSEIDELLPRADGVVIALPSNEDTHKLFDRERLLKMKRDAYIVNVGRGDIIDCDALYEVLEDGKIGGACLDVTDPEPLPADHPLWGQENIIITPHIAGGFHLHETLNRVMKIAAENIGHYYTDGQLKNRVIG